MAGVCYPSVSMLRLTASAVQYYPRPTSKGHRLMKSATLLAYGQKGGMTWSDSYSSW